ncbi:MAG: sulfotransferase domain-containing protein [Acidimicrobiia bacterium]|nr:sulfotransferase domain-containing protein [Acidimicrobiia bacterium]
MKRLLKPAVRAAQRASYPLAATERFLVVRGVVDRTRYTLPDFLGIGAAKSGTTWLHHNLATHSDVFVPPEKELHYFCHFRHRTLRWYSNRLRNAEGRITGEITPNYATLSPTRIAEVAALVPEAKLVLMIRNPMDRAWSHAQMNLGRQRGRAPETVPDNEYIDHFRSRRSIANGDYSAIVDRWTAHFPESRLWVGTYDQMVEDPVGLLTSLFEFLGVSTEVDWTDFPTHTVIDRGHPGTDTVGERGGSEEIPRRLRAELDSIYRPMMTGLAERFGAAVDAWQS